MKASTALLELFKESGGWRAFFRSCCETTPFRLRSQVWQFRDELNDQGNQFQLEEEWAHNLCKGALARLAKRYAEFSTVDNEMLDLSVLEVWDERMHEAGLANDPLAFRVALKNWERAGLGAMELSRIRGGAA